MTTKLSLCRRVGLFPLMALFATGCGKPTPAPPDAAAPATAPASAAQPATAADPAAPAAPVTPPVPAAAASAPRVSPDGYPERWNYIGASLATDKGCDDFLAALKLSAENRCTHILMPEGRSMRFPDDPAYLARVAKIKAAAEELHLKILPTVIGLGYSGRYFHYDANLAAGLPVKDMIFTVKDGKALPDASMNPDITALPKEGDTIAGTIKVQPFQHYKVTFRLSGGAGDPPKGEEIVNGRSSDGKRNNCVNNPTIKKDGDGYAGLTNFNSLEGDTLKFSIDGKGWKVSDVKIESAGLLLIVRRALVPLTVTSEDGKTTYEEGKDFEKIIDPCLHVDPFPGEVTNDHAPAEFVLTRDSRIKDGEKLKLTFWHTFRIYDDQDSISLEDPRTWEIYENEMKNLHKVWGAYGYFINYDEIRMGGWEPQPDGQHLKPGQQLAQHFKRSYDLVRKIAPGCKIYTWSDMFTPFHNARAFDKSGYYYLVNGNWDGSWEGLPKDVIIMNWYAPTPDGVKFFAEKGYQQVFCGYYDARKTEQMQNNINNWKKVSEGQPGVLGFMYTTWSHNYKNLQEYFQLVDAAKSAAKPADAKPEAEPGVPPAP
ncbi:MAG TPA: hypothetical protein VL860_13890 [Planctomycetota bacterium]|nr:hypothetical protein [Planctomycetota bacterium]